MENRLNELNVLKQMCYAVLLEVSEQINYCKNLQELKPDEKSWGMQEGVLMSWGDAEILVETIGKLDDELTALQALETALTEKHRAEVEALKAQIQRMEESMKRYRGDNLID